MKRDSLILVSLLLITTLLAVAMALRDYATWLEAVSFVTGAICVWLTVKENVWNFPIGLLNTATFSIVFLQAHLFADAGLQVIYFALGLMGWYAWLYGGQNRTRLQISLATAGERALVAAVIVVLTFLLWQLLRPLGGSASFWDALTTAISLCTQWMLNRKRLENWIGWIIVDIIYVPLYCYKALYLTAILYTVFLAMAIMGLQQWLATMKRESASIDGDIPFAKLGEI